MPSLVHTLEDNPAFIHGGLFANIDHRCNSVMATEAGLKLADYEVTETGFGANVGAEKLFDIKCHIGISTCQMPVKPFRNRSACRPTLELRRTSRANSPRRT